MPYRASFYTATKPDRKYNCSYDLTFKVILSCILSNLLNLLLALTYLICNRIDALIFLLYPHVSCNFPLPIFVLSPRAFAEHTCVSFINHSRVFKPVFFHHSLWIHTHVSPASHVFLLLPGLYYHFLATCHFITCTFLYFGGFCCLLFFFFFFFCDFKKSKKLGQKIDYKTFGGNQTHVTRAVENIHTHRSTDVVVMLILMENWSFTDVLECSLTAIDVL